MTHWTHLVRTAPDTRAGAGRFLALIAILAFAPPPVGAQRHAVGVPDTVIVESGTLKLRALLYRPNGRGPFPAVLFSHGSGPTMEPEKPANVGPLFARHGYVLLFIFRRGSGLSLDQGTCADSLMMREMRTRGQEARNTLQLQLIEGDHLNDALAGFAFLRALPEVDARRVGVMGQSFGGSLTVLLAARDSAVRTAVVFAAGGYSWDRSPPLRALLLAAVARTTAPIFFIHAANDYSIAPGESLAAEMTRLGKPHRLKIYPPEGRTTDDGHAFIDRDVIAWEADVFAFLDASLK